MADRALIEVDNTILADLYRSILADAGLNCRIEDKRSFIFGLSGKIIVHVNDSQFAEASELLKQTRPLWRKPTERLPACRRCDSQEVTFVNRRKNLYRPLGIAIAVVLVAPFLPQNLPLHPSWLLGAAILAIFFMIRAIARSPRVWHCEKCGNTMPQFSRFEIIEGGRDDDKRAQL